MIDEKAPGEFVLWVVYNTPTDMPEMEARCIGISASSRQVAACCCMSTVGAQHLVWNLVSRGASQKSRNVIETQLNTNRHPQGQAIVLNPFPMCAQRQWEPVSVRIRQCD